jgi:hypothetical protein
LPNFLRKISKSWRSRSLHWLAKKKGT